MSEADFQSTGDADPQIMSSANTQMVNPVNPPSAAAAADSTESAHAAVPPDILASSEYRVLAYAGPLPSQPLTHNQFALPDLGMLALPMQDAVPVDGALISWRCYPAAYVNWLRAINYCQTSGAAAMNMSFGPVEQLPHSPADPDPLYLALERSATKGPLPVVAAGNRYGDDSLQFLARSPFVIAVGAVNDAGSVLPFSARGPIGGDGPTVVANGFSKQREGNFAQAATSFATPRVTVLVVWLRTIFEYILDCLRLLVAGTWNPQFGLGVPIAAILDSGIDPAAYDAIRTAQAQWISRPIRQRAWLQQICAYFATHHGIASRVDTGFAGIRRAVQVLAQPIPQATRAEAGAGIVSADFFYAALRNFTPALWLALFADDHERAGSIPPAEIDGLSERFGNLFEPDFAELLIAHCIAGPGIHILRVM